MADKIRNMAKELQAYPEHQFNDRLLYLSVLKEMEHPDFASYLSSLENDSTNNATELASLLSWMGANGSSLVAIDFVRPLRPEQRSAWPVPLALAECYARIEDWRELEALTKAATWSGLEFIRHAFLARSYRGQGKSVLAAHEWAEAEKGASAQADTLLALKKMALEWGWKTETTDLLWSLTKFPQTEPEALQALYRQYSRDSDAHGLYKVLTRFAEIAPGDLTVQNNLAQICLLLGVDTGRAHKIAADIHRQEPANATYASTYAFSLFIRGDAEQAVEPWLIFRWRIYRSPRSQRTMESFWRAQTIRQQPGLILTSAPRPSSCRKRRHWSIRRLLIWSGKEQKLVAAPRPWFAYNVRAGKQNGAGLWASADPPNQTKRNPSNYLRLRAS